MLLFLFQLEGLEWLSSLGPYLTVAGILISVILKIRRDIIFRTVKEIGKGKLMDILMLINDLTALVPFEDLEKMIREARDRHAVEHGMKISMEEIKRLMGSAKETMNRPKIQELFRVEQKKRVSLIMNKKRWRRLSRDKDIDKALTSILNILHERIKLQVISNKKRAEVVHINNLVKNILSEENISKNRQARLSIERARKKLEDDKEMERLKEVRIELCGIYEGLREK